MRAPDRLTHAAAGTVGALQGDGLLLALRNGVEIGRARVSIAGDLPPGTFAYALQESVPADSVAGSQRRPLAWSAITVAGAAAGHPDLDALVAEGRLVVPPAFARAVYDALVPGTTLVVTDEQLNAAGGDLPRD